MNNLSEREGLENESEKKKIKGETKNWNTLDIVCIRRVSTQCESPVGFLWSSAVNKDR